MTAHCPRVPGTRQFLPLLTPPSPRPSGSTNSRRRRTACPS